MPLTTEIIFRLEKDVDTHIRYHLDNFNRIFKIQNQNCRFQSKADTFISIPETGPQVKFYGVPDIVLTLDSKVLSFVEVKTPNDLPVSHHENGLEFQLSDIYEEEIQYITDERIRGDIGRKDVRTLIDQVYGYLSLNNLIYGCVTCYDATYFLWRPKRGTLRISDPIFNSSSSNSSPSSPTLLQALYFFVQLVLVGHRDSQQKLEPSPKDSDMPEDVKMDTEDVNTTQAQSDSGSNYSTSDYTKGSGRMHYNVDLDLLRSGTVIGSGATGQAIRLKDRDIVVKHCDSYNNPDGFKMLKNEISIYEKLSKFNLKYVPRYYGECEFHGQHFMALEFIPGNHCHWKTNSELKDKLKLLIRDLKSFGVIHGDLKPENVLLTPEGDLKLIDFGMAEYIE